MTLTSSQIFLSTLSLSLCLQFIYFMKKNYMGPISFYSALLEVQKELKTEL